MPIDGLLAANNQPAGQLGDPSSSFRQADFLKIMLAELANQDPFKPQETGQIVENMRKLQELANTQFEKFRQDMRFAQEIAGERVIVQQVNEAEDQLQRLREQGINPDPGYGVVEGTVESYRMIGETVWLTVDGKDYPIDNLQQLRPREGRDPERLAELADQLVAREVEYPLAEGGTARGLVTDVSMGKDGAVTLTVDGTAVPFETVSRIGLPINAAG